MKNIFIVFVAILALQSNAFAAGKAKSRTVTGHKADLLFEVLGGGASDDTGVAYNVTCSREQEQQDGDPAEDQESLVFYICDGQAEVDGEYYNWLSEAAHALFQGLAVDGKTTNEVSAKSISCKQTEEVSGDSHVTVIKEPKTVCTVVN